MSNGRMERCTHGAYMPANGLARLPPGQGAPARHLCAVCAYAQGHHDGMLEQLTATKTEDRPGGSHSE